jgi:Rod binding domain-containing protein
MESGTLNLSTTGLGNVARLASEPGSGRTDNQQLFSQVISRAKTDAAETPEQRARKAAEQLVSTALVQPILKQMRESNNAAPPFAPNEAERTFRSFMDASLAQRMVGSQRWGLVDQLARRMLGRLGQQSHTPPTMAPPQ